MMSGAFLSPLVQPSPGQGRPSVLVVDRSADRRLFLRTSLQDRCRVATAATGDEGVAHLRHCPPRALIVGGVPGDEGRAVFRAGGRGARGPATLTLWATGAPSEWADAALRHPFTREDLIRTVDRLLRDKESGGAKPGRADTLPRQSRLGR